MHIKEEFWCPLFLCGDPTFQLSEFPQTPKTREEQFFSPWPLPTFLSSSADIPLNIKTIFSKHPKPPHTLSYSQLLYLSPFLLTAVDTSPNLGPPQRISTFISPFYHQSPTTNSLPSISEHTCCLQQTFLHP